MISSLRGPVLATSADSLVVEVGGVGLRVAVPADVAHTARIGGEIRLHTSLIVREDALLLYGFAQSEELEVFEVLLGVTGVGPKSALGVLSHMSVDQIATAVADDDDAPFRRVSGIGPKTAKLIVVQLAGKIAPAAAPTASQAGDLPADTMSQLVAALVGLGWTERVAAEAAERTAGEASETERASVALLLRRTLATLGPAQAGGARG
ncbi:Holliday junction branch migration protein RuvA [Microbacterium pseudoresistens]|uniref:Holliday junction branch migration complex subunit RuvA n=1 Tax=Microbacterium pseudoresistens TaxID=640634 RepID=A0A7Y9EWZ6_9MICO|nr:Holliday junction branch migration protein RuvA [Microbacterium pseudoresistens]NYD55500.1 Holliday junction DNA helicase RuvA [Microbacterium pseudoresistens]